ncbi:MAG: hypothetical protein ACRDJY_10305 [Thermoleophilaceae bacterium]
MSAIRRAPIRIAALALSLGLAACGDDDGGSSKSAPAVQVVGAEYAFAMPDQVEGGMTRMDFVNTGKEVHEYGLGRFERGKTLADLDKVLARGGEPPEWVDDIGGVPALTPGDRISITRRLRPGTYGFVCFIPGPNGKPHYELGMKTQFTVAGDSGAASPDADGVVVAGDKKMEVPTVSAGRQTLELRNAAVEPREFNLLTLDPGKTRRDAGRWFNGGFKGEPPLKFLGAMQSIAPGTSVFLTADFESGRTYEFADEENELRARVTVK